MHLLHFKVFKIKKELFKMINNKEINKSEEPSIWLLMGPYKTYGALSILSTK